YSGADDNDPYPRENVQVDGTWAHGTHVSGILGITTDNSLGIASTSYNASVVAVKCSRENQQTEPYVNDGYAGITYAAKAGYYSDTFTIINCSWGGGGYNSYEQTTINNAHNTYGAVIVGAAGNGSNSGGEENSAHYPSSYENVISVCALGCGGTWGHWATYHNTVDLGAPGENVLSCIIGSGYQAWDGSSMASPNAASCIGLLKAYYPEWNNTQLEETIISSADPIIYEINDEAYLNGNLGSGMVDVHKAIGAINFPYLYYYSHSLLNIEGDGDGVLNPGEATELRVTLGNVEGWTNATEVTAVLTTDNPSVTITDPNADYGTIYAGGIQINIADTYAFSLSEDIDLGQVDFTIEVSTVSAQGEPVVQYVPFSIEVSLNQEGWPISTLGDMSLYNIETAPLVLDVDSNGQNEIYFSDYSGNVYAVNPDGSEIINLLFPFDTGNQVWGSPAAADIDGDGHIEIIVSSKSKHLFILDPVDQIIQADYYAAQFLMGTPSIGNIDDDGDLEVIIGGFSSPGKVFAINPDGTDVPGFPYELGEKMMRGLALADFNDNGKVDIVCGTENNKIWVIYDDTTIADGFPFTSGERFRAAPVIINGSFGKVILAGCRDDNFYALNQDGTIRFSVPASDYILTSPAVYENNGLFYIFFGSNDGGLYGVDIDGSALPGWPILNNSSIVTSPVIADLNFDGNP
ncbi:MAG: S8 family serine peptidase, partial [Fidelibacterota bacterium]